MVPVTKKSAYEPAISAREMSTFLAAVTGLVWLISGIVYATSLLSLTYTRYYTEQIRSAVRPVSCQPAEVNDYELVHVDCPVKTAAAGSIKIPSQFESSLSKADLANAVFFDMSIEMYQKGNWYDHIVGGGTASGSLYFPAVDGIGRQFASTVYAGNFVLEPSVLPELFKTRRPLKLIDHNRNQAPSPTLRLSSKNTRVYQDALYTSIDPRYPSEGDLRVQFFVNAATHVSVIGVQSPLGGYYKGAAGMMRWIDDKLPPLLGQGVVRSLVPYREDSSDLRTLIITAEGDHNADQLLALHELEHNAFAPLHFYAVTVFAVASTALGYSLLRRFAPAADTPPAALMLTAVFSCFGLALTLASFPSVFLPSSWRIGLLQLLGGAAGLSMATWTYHRAPEVWRESCLGGYDRPYVALTPRNSLRVDEATELVTADLAPSASEKAYAAV